MKNNRPIILIANSSWYLLHYRLLLLSSLQDRNRHVVALSPVDSATPSLSKLLIQIPWRITRSTDSNPFYLVISFFRILFLVRAIKPRLVHSHTLKANLLAAIVTAIFGVPCVLSFAGMGRLSKSHGIRKIFFNLTLSFIGFWSNRKRSTRWGWSFAPRRCAMIFQNPVDLKLFHSSLPHFPKDQTHLIPGSGVPARYFYAGLSHSNVNHWFHATTSAPKCELLFCGRLLESKGIGIFLGLANTLSQYHFTVFGALDRSSKDSISANELEVLRLHHQNVFFAGSQEDPLINCSASFPVLLIPSRYGEGLPRALIEALALGIPVICSKTATCGIFSSDIVYVADSGNVEDYVRCVDQVLADFVSGQLRLRLQAGRSLAEQDFSEVTIVEKTIALYDDLEKKHDHSYLLNKDDHRLHDWVAQ